MRTAIMMTVKDIDIVNSITKQLYSEITNIYHSTSARVERAICHPIEVAFERGEQKILYEIFGNTIQAEKGKVTNSEFIAIVAERIRLSLKD